MRAFLQTIAVFVIGAAIIIVTALLINGFRQPTIIERERITEKLLKEPDCPRSFEVYKDLVNGGQSVVLVKNVSTYASLGELVNLQEIKLKRSGEGEVACGYLYARANKDGKPLEDKFESIYVSPQEFGGHLLNRKGMPILDPITRATEVLLPLNAIPYLPRVPFDADAQDFRIADWVKLLNVTNEVVFRIGLSVGDSRGAIEEVRIAYKCWNPEIGRETQDCQLSVE